MIDSKLLIDQLKALYAPKGGVCPPDIETPAGKAGAQEEPHQMNQLSFKSVPVVKSEPGVSSVIRSLLARSSDGVVTIAPGIAQRVLEEANFEGQRKVSQSRVNERIHDIQSGNWNPRITAINFAATPDGRLHLVNGQHRLQAIARAGKATDNLVVIADVEDMASVRRLYALFDTPESKRSDMDMLDGIGAAKTLGLSRKTTSALFKALVMLRNEMEPVAGADIYNLAKSRNARLEDMADWAPEAKVYESIIHAADGYLQKKLLAQSTMAFSLYVLRHQKKTAIEFLRGIAENDGLRKGDPRARLIADFQNRALGNGSYRQGIQRMAVAWNAFVTGRDLTVIKCHEGAAIVIKGTPKGKAGGQ